MAGRTWLLTATGAEEVGLKEQQWVRWEPGRSVPRADNLAMLAERLGIPLADFYDPDALVSDSDRMLAALTRIEAKLDVLINAQAQPRTFCSTAGGDDPAFCAGRWWGCSGRRPLGRVTGKPPLSSTRVLEPARFLEMCEREGDPEPDAVLVATSILGGGGTAS